ncbi:putative phosphoribosyl transferase [Pelotomaculum sp. FP]|uniref:phosphoribosyltransferase n=1 Tax=Pelotomaculum sp. FP TaxID=261474 RepID=UPI0010658070|nr:phosphoribosyltransferase family protein [Pelotomaculum sp. FP]TEB17833.1 putative phosphoribosyl transferase [Pelotomaculum sp. FP]
MIFRNRAEAGRQLAEKLAGFIERDALVLAVPRGGVVIAAEIVRMLNLNIDLIIPRKIGAPHNPEVAIGAVTQDGTTLFEPRLIELLGISRGELEDRVAYELEEIRRRMTLYGAGRNIGKSGGRQLIVVDDGVATGYTMQAALRSARSYGPKELVLAIPVAPRDTLELLEKEVDRTVCLMVPEDFYAVGQFYENFEQTEDEEVMEIMRRFSDL